MKKIVVMYDMPKYKEIITNAAPDFDIVFTKTKEDAVNEIKDAQIIVGWNRSVEQSLKDGNTSIKWIQSVNAGVDNVPVELLKEKGIILTKATNVHPYQLSESIFGQMLAMERKIKVSILAQAESKWDSSIGASGIDEIHHKTIGIIGAGEIGQEVARIAFGFSMYTIGVKRTQTPVPYMDEIYTMDKIKEVVKRCDYIVNLLPSTPETIGLFNKDIFDEMRYGTSFFNFGRGDAVVSDDLIAAIESGRLKIVGLDVATPEPLPASNPLWKMDNVIITPHIAGKTPYYYDRLFESFADNLKEYVKNGSVKNGKINFDNKY